MADIVQDNTGKYTPKPLKSIASLSKEEQDELINGWVSSGKLPRSWSMDQADRLYKNKQFRDKYGEDTYAAMTDKSSEHYISPEVRDEYYNRNEYSAGVASKYANDPRLEEYMAMTTEGLQDLWESGIMSPEELEAEEKRLNSQRNSAEENKIKPKNRLLSAFIGASQEDYDGGAPAGSMKETAEAIALSRGLLHGEDEERVKNKVEAKAQEKTDKLAGAIRTGLDDKDVDSAIKSLYANNAKKIDELQKREDTRIINLQSVQDEVTRRNNDIYQKINDGEMTYQQVEDIFRETFDNDIRGDQAGSRYYTGYKNKSELSKFGVDDMLKTLNEFQVLTEAFGGDQAKAMQTIDTKMFNIAKDNQSFWKRRANVLVGTAAKANSMMVNEVFGGFADMYHVLADKPNEYKAYKTAEDVLTSGGFGYLFNPNYWNYVDQYAMWNPAEIQRINDNGGIGGRVNLYSPTGKMTGEQFVDEGFKMLGYMLPAAAITAATKKIPAGSGWAKLIAGWEIAGSAAALGSAYSTGVYNEVLLGSQQALDQMFNEESKDFVKQYYAEHPDYVANYLKANGIKEGDSELISLPVRAAAEKQLYELAKEEYFNQHPERKKAYSDAQDQILYDAQNGARVDDLIETARMLVSGSFWGKWTKSKLTRDLLNKQINPVGIYDGAAAQAISRGASRGKAIAMTLLSGGVDNWLDDITAGVGKGLGLNDFNNYLGTVYGPNDYVEGSKFTADILDGILWGMKGAEDAFYNPQTWIDGALGATGSILGARINGITLVRDAITKDGVFSREGTEAGKSWAEQTAWQKLNRYVTNGITTSVADADAGYARTEEWVKKFNDVTLPKYNEDIQKVGSFLNENYDFNTMADSIMDGKDIKQIGMLKSAIRMREAMNDPVLSQVPQIQQFSDMLKRGRDGQFTEAEIQSYINDPSNTELKQQVETTGDTSAAVEAMQKNVNNFLTISDTYGKLAEGINKNPRFSALNEAAKTQIAVQLTLRDVWKERLDKMQESLNTPGSEKATHSFEAEFGSAEGREETIKSLEALVNKHKEQLRLRQRDLKIKEDALNKATTPEARELAYNAYAAAVFLRDHERNLVSENTALLREKRKANVAFDEEGYARVLSEEEIMRLSPKQRAEMLNPENKRRYSAEQNRVIDNLTDRLKNYVDENGQTQDLYQVAIDAGTMQDRLEGSDKSIREVIKNPYMLKTYMDRVKERRMALVAQAALSDLRKGQLQKLDSVTTPEEAIDVIYRGKHPANTADKGFYIPATVVNEYIEKNPDKAAMMKEAADMVQTRDDLYLAADNLFETAEATQMRDIIARATSQATSKADIISSIEEQMDAQTDPNAKLQFDRLLEKMRSYGYQRDATKARDREVEKQRKAEEEAKQKEEAAKLEGKTYGIDGYKVGDTVYSKETGTPATVVGFEESAEGNKMVLEVNYADGTKGKRRYTADTAKERLTKEPPKTEKPTPAPVETKTERKGDKEIKAALKDLEESDTNIDKQDAIRAYDEAKKNGAETTAEEDAIIEKARQELANVGVSTTDAVEQVAVEDVPLDSDGGTASPTAAEQAAAEGSTEVATVPTTDATDQGNVIAEDIDGVITGNRWVEYSIESLKDGIVKQEVPDNPKSVFGRLREWLDNNKIKLQEIIDEEFGRILTDNPNIDVRFMMMPEDRNNPLTRVLFNVIELTPAMRQKYHDESRGGIIQADGKTWLVVGTTGFENGSSTERMHQFDLMKGPISKRRFTYFKNNPSEKYYVDNIAYSRVQNTTSGRIVNQRLGEESAKLQKVSELLKSAGLALKDGIFGIQTKQVGEKSFATTKNRSKKKGKLFPPRNVEDNRGRTFIVLDTANGNLIPGMIEPAMFNNLAEDSPLKEMINSTIARLFSTNYDVRHAAISELRGYLLLEKDGKNILIGTKDTNMLTITRPGMEDIKQTLGPSFDAVKFLKDLENANFQINITLKSLNDPAMLKLYDDSGALMTSVGSMRTAGMSYTLYMTDSQGRPIMNVPVGNATPGTGKTEFKQYRSVRVNNNTYEFRGGRFIDRNTKQPVDPNSELGKSCLYNQAIDEGKWAPFSTKRGKEYYSVQAPDGSLFVVSRDGKGNIEFLDKETSDRMLKRVKNEQDRQQRMQNLEEVDLYGDTTTPVPTGEPTAVEDVNLDDLAKHMLGDYTEAQEAPPAEAPAEVAKEVQEIPVQQPKEVISTTGTKSLADLQNTEKLSTFAQIVGSTEYSDRLYDILESKGWDITGDFAKDEEIVKSKGISTVGITNIEDWLNLIRDCK